jgi:hypothetical protein
MKALAYFEIRHLFGLSSNILDKFCDYRVIRSWLRIFYWDLPRPNGLTPNSS